MKNVAQHKGKAEFIAEQKPLQIRVDLDVIVTVVARAIEVFGTRDKAIDWLRTPLPALSHRTPISIMNTTTGVEQIQDVLGRIEHGIW
ncbi:MAG TPA: MbcA/ParS/Xre antitoxin family protein [Bryobacteraceae bacterium]|jgi:putative toxin-antitoxin system antitoxin component (TIGR02293 family)